MIQIIPTQFGFKLVDEEVCVSLTIQEARKELRRLMRIQAGQERQNLMRRGIEVFNRYTVG